MLEPKNRVIELKGRLNSICTIQQNKDLFIKAVRKHIEMDCVTAPQLGELIELIDVHEVEGIGKNRTQRIGIHFRFIGYSELSKLAFKSNFKVNTRQGIAVEYVPKTIPE